MVGLFHRGTLQCYTAGLSPPESQFSSPRKPISFPSPSAPVEWQRLAGAGVVKDSAARVESRWCGIAMWPECGRDAGEVVISGRRRNRLAPAASSAASTRPSQSRVDLTTLFPSSST